MVDFNDDLFGEVISRYTRQNAIDDGVLIPFTGELRKLADEAGILWPIAMTATSFHACIWPREGGDNEAALKDQGQSLAGRAWDVLNLLRFAIRAHARTRSDTAVRFEVSVTEPDRKQKTYELRAVAGPDDEGKPCITIMFPEED